MKLERVYYFSQGARGASNLGVKITFYGTCFEALFCTESSEISYKLAERVAFFCEDSPAARLDILRTMKAAYNIRSKTVHGDKLKPAVAQQAATVAAQCDMLLRRILTKLLESRNLYDLFTGKPEDLEDYLVRMVFGVV